MGCKTSKVPVVEQLEKPGASSGRRPSITSGVRLKQERSTINEYMVSLNEVRKVRDVYTGFNNGKMLGTGNWGTVRVVKRKDDNKQFACKILRLSNNMTDHKMEELRTEIKILAKMDHPYIAKLYEVYEDPGLNLYLIMELLKGGELYTKLTKNSELGHYTEADAAKAVTQMFSAVAFLHENGIVHRDLKLENFVYRDSDAEQQLVLIDFGLSKRFHVNNVHAHEEHNEFHDVVGSSYYIAPEVLEGSYGVECDMWSMGVIVFMLLSGRPPFGGKNESEIMKRALLGEYSMKHKVWNNVTDQAKDFVNRLLRKKPSDRMTAHEALSHPWLARRRSSLEGVVLSNTIVNNIARYTESNELRRLALNAVAFSMSRAELMDLRLAFESIDTDGTGHITKSEFCNALREYPNLNVDEMFSAMDIDKEGKIHLTEFLAAALQTSALANEVNLLHAFERLDIEHTGKITVETLREILGGNLSSDDVSRIIRNFVKDAGVDSGKEGNAEIDYKAFLRAMRHQNEPFSPVVATPILGRGRRFPSDLTLEDQSLQKVSEGGRAMEA